MFVIESGTRSGRTKILSTNSIRRSWSGRRRRGRLTPLLAGVVVALAACSSSGGGSDMPAYQSEQNPAESASSDLSTQTYATTAEVLEAVTAAQSTQALPPGASEQLVAMSQVARSNSNAEEAGPEKCFDKLDIRSSAAYTSLGDCAYGDPNGTKLMVIYGDSRAQMWVNTLERVSATTGWKVRLFAQGGCPVADLQFRDNRTGVPDAACDEFHATAIEEINKLHPQLVITASNVGHKLANGETPTPAQWQDAWVSTFQKLTQPGTRLAMLGAIPAWNSNDAQCLAAHTQDVQACSTDRANAISDFFDAEKAAAAAAGAHYVDTVPWVCAEKCQPVIADTIVYYNPFHFTKRYAVYLSGAVAEALAPAMG
ncbi:SGNH hydrolase domain-containing protein [Mycolicibacterium vaccae]|nr:SGNH hydrolase domain-containing protein [Mycolicibacterium vaccae]